MAAPSLSVRIGCHMVYEAKEPTVALFLIKPRRDGDIEVSHERLWFSPTLRATEYEDIHGNITHRAELRPGENVIHHDAIVEVPPEADNHGLTGTVSPFFKIAPDFRRNTMPSRYCDSDKLNDFARDHFGKI